jgi:hypothetical protein
MSIRGEIITAIAQRLAKVKPSNGYTCDVKKVYYDKIPLGLQLTKDKVPAIFLLDRINPLALEHKVVKGDWEFDLQIWDNVDTGDIAMANLVSEVFKVLFADSPNAQREDAFRSLHPNIVELVPTSIASDLQMIDANRVQEISFTVKYRTKLFAM